jgi:hypothetical protein
MFCPINKKLLLVLVVGGFLFFANTTLAQMGMMETSPPENAGRTGEEHANFNTVLREILQTQKVEDKSEISCAQVTDEQFEELGDAYMELIHPGEAHKVMDAMMGGEGSTSLRQAHINMGRSSLGCWSDYRSGTVFMPMSGYGMMNGFGVMHSDTMFGGYSINRTIFSFIWFIFAVIGIFTVVKWVINYTNQQK